MTNRMPGLVTLVSGASGVGKSRLAAFAAVIADHVASGARVVMEGDYLTAELALAHPGAVRTVVLDEPDERQLVANYHAREPLDPGTPDRVRVSVLVGARLAERARAVRMPVLPARPWADQVDRVDRALRAC